MPRPTTALIIDDEAHVRVYLRMVLKSLGVMSIMEASHGEEALHMYADYHPEVVLLDVILPGLTSQFVLQEILAMDSQAAVIIVTSQNSSKTVQEMHDLGAVSYLLKHTPREQMMKMLAETLDWIGEGMPETEGEGPSSS